MHLADRQLNLSPLNMPYTAVNRALRLDGEPRTKVCIYGAGMFRGEAPLDDPTWEVWNLNLCPAFDAAGLLRADRWFDLHQRCAQTKDDLRWIAKCPVPIYVPDDLLSASTNAVRFPLESIEAKMGGYWACTFAYQIALAMHEGFTDIGLYGVELAFGTARERTVEWACVSYWLGRAEERGLTIHLPEKSTLGRHTARYGLEYTVELDAVKRYTQQMNSDLLLHAMRGEKAEGMDSGG